MLVRIDNERRHTHGWQARAWTVRPHYLSRLCSDSVHGGPNKAKRAARRAEAELQLEAARVARAMKRKAAR